MTALFLGICVTSTGGQRKDAMNGAKKAGKSTYVVHTNIYKHLQTSRYKHLQTMTPNHENSTQSSKEFPGNAKPNAQVNYILGI